MTPAKRVVWEKCKKLQSRLGEMQEFAESFGRNARICRVAGYSKNMIDRGFNPSIFKPFIFADIFNQNRIEISSF